MSIFIMDLALMVNYFPSFSKCLSRRLFYELKDSRPKLGANVFVALRIGKL